MLVLMTDNQLLSPQQVCQTCLLANQQGQPRWHQGQLRCGQALHGVGNNQPAQYQCQMGFRVVNIE